MEKTGSSRRYRAEELVTLVAQGFERQVGAGGFHHLAPQALSSIGGRPGAISCFLSASSTQLPLDWRGRVGTDGTDWRIARHGKPWSVRRACENVACYLQVPMEGVAHITVLPV